MKRGLAILILLAALGAGSEGAAAEPGPLLPPLPPRQLMTQVGAPVAPARSFHSGFVVEASNGYKVGVMTFGDAVVLVVFRGDQRHFKRISETAYLARGIVAPERLQATFGRFGKVSMRFRESRHRPWVGKRRRCRGDGRFVKRRGVFVGNLRFKGEDGYVSVRVHRAKGAVLTLAEKCRRHENRRARRRTAASGEEPFLAPPQSALFATSRDGVDTTGILALQYRGKMILLSTAEEARSKLAIVRIALVRTRASIPVNEAVTAAKLSAPAPFHGTGRYHAAPDGTVTWSGNLSVDFPGAPRYPLTGPEFAAFIEVPF
jgi:hypothetical protein